MVFDLDGTLVAGDSFAWFLAFRLRRTPWRLGLVALTSPAWLVLGLRRSSRLQAERIVSWAVVVGLGRDRVLELVRLFAEEHAGADGRRRVLPALQRLRQHVAHGDRVVVATACAEPVAREICRVLDLPGVEVVASRFTVHRWRLPEAVPARGEHKLRALRAAGIEPPVDHAYSDSSNDLPLLLAARRAHLVRPSRCDLLLLQRALGPDVEILH